MGYLLRNDYKGLIQIDNLSQIIGSDYSILSRAELAAQSEVISYLIQKYITTQEFTDTIAYVYGVTRNAKDRVYLDATAYSATATYALNALMLLNGDVYRCTSEIRVPEAYNAGHWALLGAQYTIYYVTNPETDWDYYTQYVAGDQVFYKNKTYTATRTNSALAPDANSIEWGLGVAYSVAGSVLPTDTAKWTAGDNRNPQMVNYMVDVVLYHIHSRIAPRNIPDLRVKRYDDAIGWLKSCAKGDWITASLPKIQPKSGMRSRWGSRLPKQNNNF
jgi:hypothetical protein